MTCLANSIFLLTDFPECGLKVGNPPKFSQNGESGAPSRDEVPAQERLPSQPNTYGYGINIRG